MRGTKVVIAGSETPQRRVRLSTTLTATRTLSAAAISKSRVKTTTQTGFKETTARTTTDGAAQKTTVCERANSTFSQNLFMVFPARYNAGAVSGTTTRFTTCASPLPCQKNERRGSIRGI